MTPAFWTEVRRLAQAGLSRVQIAADLGASRRTVSRALALPSLPTRAGRQAGANVAPYLALLLAKLETHPSLTSRRLFLIASEAGYTGGYRTLCRAVEQLRPASRPAFRTLVFAPGEMAQVDWGCAGPIRIGSVRRRLSYFVMVLCHSRMLYVELTLGEATEHWLMAHRRAFEFFGGVPRKVMVDNCKTAVTGRRPGREPEINGSYLLFAQRYGFEIVPCGVRKPWEKGRVENAVGYVRKSFLAGRRLEEFETLKLALRRWLDETANQRDHNATGTRPADLFAKDERPALRPLPAIPHPCAVRRVAVADSRFRVAVDGNKYSLPSAFAGRQVEVALRDDLVSLYHGHELVAEHPRCYDRKQDIAHDGHDHELRVRRRQAQIQKSMAAFMKLGAVATRYLDGIRLRRLGGEDRHAARIADLIQTFGRDAVRRAVEDAVEMEAFNTEAVYNLCSVRAGAPPEEAAHLHLLRNRDLLDMTVPDVDLSRYDTATAKKGPQR